MDALCVGPSASLLVRVWSRFENAEQVCIPRTGMPRSLSNRRALSLRDQMLLFACRERETLDCRFCAPDNSHVHSHLMFVCRESEQPTEPNSLNSQQQSSVVCPHTQAHTHTLTRLSRRSRQQPTSPQDDEEGLLRVRACATPSRRERDSDSSSEPRAQAKTPRPHKSSSRHTDSANNREQLTRLDETRARGKTEHHDHARRSFRSSPQYQAHQTTSTTANAASTRRQAHSRKTCRVATARLALALHTHRHTATSALLAQSIGLTRSFVATQRQCMHTCVSECARASDQPTLTALDSHCRTRATTTSVVNEVRAHKIYSSSLLASLCTLACQLVKQTAAKQTNNLLVCLFICRLFV